MSRQPRSSPGTRSAHAPDPATGPVAEVPGIAGDPVELADQITNRLFGVTLDLHHIRALAQHPAATGRVDRVIDELDYAINELRLLVAAIDPPLRRPPEGE